jgi:hypothetical protein
MNKNVLQFFANARKHPIIHLAKIQKNLILQILFLKIHR